MAIQKDTLFESLPVEKKEDIFALLRQQAQLLSCTIVVLDDDPTGTQTVYDVPVLTQWQSETLEEELRHQIPLFYILTNSRSLTPEETIKLHKEIAHNLKKASKSTARDFLVISRSDSTLRGHYPLEVDVLKNELDLPEAVTILIPAFFDGGRYTIDDIHYVEEKGKLIPANQTPFALDPSFGYQNANLRDWIIEKSAGAIVQDQIMSISLTDIRERGVDFISNQLINCQAGMVCIINAASPKDLGYFALAFFKTLNTKQQFILRTAASIVPLLVGLAPQNLLNIQGLNPAKKAGLTVIGSYVPKTTMQLEYLRNHLNFQFIEIDVVKLLSDDWQNEVDQVSKSIENHLEQENHVVVFTSRILKKTANAVQNLAIGKRVSEGLVAIVKNLNTQPGYLLAKGGITSSDIATKALQVKRATVKGQILPGVPVWELGDETRFPNMSYIIFPGNVGGEEALSTALQKLT